MIRLTIFLIAASMLILGCINPNSNTRSLILLSQLAKDAKCKQMILKQETESFQKAKTYLTENKIRKGFSVESAVKEFGNPVLIVQGEKEIRWVYKPSDVNWIGGEKIYLFFDQANSLIDWKCINCR
ncbi:MAG: hypothetical protein ABIC18_03685 [Candidatus Omnitrophota bacterium]